MRMFHFSKQKMIARILSPEFTIAWTTAIPGHLISHVKKPPHRHGSIRRRELISYRHILIMKNGCLINRTFRGLMRVCRGTWIRNSYIKEKIKSSVEKGIYGGLFIFSFSSLFLQIGKLPLSTLRSVAWIDVSPSRMSP